jgi:hypothetical protein
MRSRIVDTESEIPNLETRLLHLPGGAPRITLIDGVGIPCQLRNAN